MIKASTSLSINDLLSEKGVISQSFKNFESRPQQIQMGQAVEKAIINKRHLAVEAGTGVGKSFSYLVPVIKAVSQGTGKILVSTFTITLQEQLINKDLPFLAEALPYDFSAVLAKGRSNYVCLRRLEFTLRRRDTGFLQIADELEKINLWATQTKDGSLSDLPFVPSAQAWDAVRSEHGNCPGRRCRDFQKCFYRKARRLLDSTDIIVANHALMFSDLALKEQSVKLLPEYKFAIIDEAHNLEAVAQEHFGIDISNYRVKFLLDRLYNPGMRRGILAYQKTAQKALDILGNVRKQSTVFFRNVRNWYDENININNGRCFAGFVDDCLTGPLKLLRSELSAMANNCKDIDEKFELINFSNRCAALIVDIEDFLGQKKKEYVYWVERTGSRRINVRLKSAPLNVGPDVKRCLFDKHESVTLTSATLSSDGKDEKQGFNFLASRIGLEEFDALKLGSPFDYYNQVTMYIEKDLPQPNTKEFLPNASEAVKKYILQTQGRAFVLFTSYSMLEKFADTLCQWLTDNDIKLFQQGSGLDRGELLRRFKQADRAVLFGTDSFWQGVDVPGGDLSNVIIVRLPFAVPNQPLLAGRLEQIKEQGGNPFMDYQLPSAIIKFKQGFGRLIRTKTDTGIVVILDSRIINKRYGQQFLCATPKCKLEIVGTSK